MIVLGERISNDEDLPPSAVSLPGPATRFNRRVPHSSGGPVALAIGFAATLAEAPGDPTPGFLSAR